jgi:hypothetical protein
MILSLRLAGLWLAVLTLAACASGPPSSSPMADGPPVMPPLGWLAYCAAHGDDPSCSR